MGADTVLRRALLGTALLLAGCSGLQTWVDQQVLTEEPTLVMDASTQLHAPEQLEVASNTDRTIVLKWAPVLVGDVAGYVILRAVEPEGPFVPVGRTNSPFGTIFSDSGSKPGALGDGQIYVYRVHAFDGAGRVSGEFAEVPARTEEPPPPPEGLTAYSNLPRKVVLTWSPSASPRVGSYAVSRSPTTAGPYEQIGVVSGRQQTLYEDPVPGDLRVLYYRITALNRFGGESEPSEPVRAVTKPEPLPPIGLRASALDLGAIRLAWEPNVEGDLVAYEVWRTLGHEGAWDETIHVGEVPVVQTAAEKPAYLDSAVGCGQAVRYWLRARDRDGLVSDYSTSLQTRGLDLGLSIALEADHAELRWQPEPTRGWQRARIDAQRRLGPARTLGHVDAAGPFRLPADLSGEVTLSVTLERAAPGDASDTQPQQTPACDIAAQLPDPAAAAAR